LTAVVTKIWAFFKSVVSGLLPVSVKSHNVLVKHLKLKPTHEDFELKKLLINQLVLLTEDPTVLPVSSVMFFCR